MIVFHGSRDEIKTALSLDHVGKGMGSNENGYGFFSAREISTAYLTKERISEPRWSYNGDQAALKQHCPDLSARLIHTAPRPSERLAETLERAIAMDRHELKMNWETFNEYSKLTAMPGYSQEELNQLKTRSFEHLQADLSRVKLLEDQIKSVDVSRLVCHSGALHTLEIPDESELLTPAPMSEHSAEMQAKVLAAVKADPNLAQVKFQTEFGELSLINRLELACSNKCPAGSSVYQWQDARNNLSGLAVHNSFCFSGGGDKAGALALKEIGIPGIKREFPDDKQGYARINNFCIWDVSKMKLGGNLLAATQTPGWGGPAFKTFEANHPTGRRQLSSQQISLEVDRMMQQMQQNQTRLRSLMLAQAATDIRAQESSPEKRVVQLQEMKKQIHNYTEVLSPVVTPEMVKLEMKVREGELIESTRRYAAGDMSGRSPSELKTDYKALHAELSKKAEASGFDRLPTRRDVDLDREFHLPSQEAVDEDLAFHEVKMRLQSGQVVTESAMRKQLTAGDSQMSVLVAQSALPGSSLQMEIAQTAGSAELLALSERSDNPVAVQKEMVKRATFLLSPQCESDQLNKPQMDQVREALGLMASLTDDANVGRELTNLVEDNLLKQTDSRLEMGVYLGTQLESNHVLQAAMEAGNTVPSTGPDKSIVSTRIDNLDAKVGVEGFKAPGNSPDIQAFF